MTIPIRSLKPAPFLVVRLKIASGELKERNLADRKKINFSNVIIADGEEKQTNFSLNHQVDQELAL